MTNKTMKARALALGVTLASSYLVAASLPETSKNTKASASSIGPAMKAYLASGDQNAPNQPKYNTAQLMEHLEQQRAQERENFEKQAASGDQNAQKRLNFSAAVGFLGFTKESGLKYLSERAKNNDQNAQEWLNKKAIGAATASGDQHAQEEMNSVNGSSDLEEVD